MKFFLVDDDEIIVRLMTVLLEAAGHEVASNLSGLGALPEIREFRPDCVITDLMMASLDGIDLIDEIRSKPNLKNVKIIMVTAREADHWRKKAEEHGALGVITKPIDKESFVDDVTAMLAA